MEPSYVLRALGAAEDMAHSSLRFGIGRFSTDAEVEYITKQIIGTVHRLREMRYAYLATTAILLLILCHSPLWEMVQEGIDINSIDWSQH